jgi:hypothetical protein
MMALHCFSERVRAGRGYSSFFKIVILRAAFAYSSLRKLLRSLSAHVLAVSFKCL